VEDFCLQQFQEHTAASLRFDRINPFESIVEPDFQTTSRTKAGRRHRVSPNPFHATGRAVCAPMRQTRRLRRAWRMTDESSPPRARIGWETLRDATHRPPK